MENREATVLVVDDDPFIRLHACGVMEEAGYSTKQAGDPDEAMRLIAVDGITIVITDIEMPGSMDGLALARRIRAMWPHISVIVSSGHRLPRADELPDGIPFLSKPYSHERLLSLVGAQAQCGR